jgi:hypothetical protein
VQILAHDQDAGLSRTVADLEWSVVEMLDRNHAVKSYETRWKNAAYLPGTPRGEWIPYMKEIRQGLKMRFYTCLKMDGDAVERRREWMGAYEHFTQMPRQGSRRQPWSAREDPQAQERLRQFLESVADLLEKVRTRFSTQLCECLNSMKAKLACKGISWKRSWEARVCVAVLNFNLGTPGRWISTNTLHGS